MDHGVECLLVVARKKKHAPPAEREDAPVAVPVVGTSLKALLKGVSLEGGKNAKTGDRPSQGTGKPSQGAGKPSQGTGKPSQGTGKPSQGTGKPSQGTAKATGQIAKTPPLAQAAPGSETPAVAPPAVAPRPSDTLRGDDRIAFYDAIAGVRSLDHDRPARPRRAVPVRTADPAPAPSREAIDAPARQKLGELVAGAHRFDLAVDADGFVEGLRRDAPIEALGALRRDKPRIDGTLDLHGLRENVVEDRLARWLRESHKKGSRRVLVIHGKGLHSADGVAVLREAVLRVLQASIATPLVLAFASAPAAMGGTGAMLVELTKDRS